MRKMRTWRRSGQSCWLAHTCVFATGYQLLLCFSDKKRKQECTVEQRVCRLHLFFQKKKKGKEETFWDTRNVSAETNQRADTTNREPHFYALLLKAEVSSYSSTSWITVELEACDGFTYSVCKRCPPLGSCRHGCSANMTFKSCFVEQSRLAHTAVPSLRVPGRINLIEHVLNWINHNLHVGAPGLLNRLEYHAAKYLAI